MKYKAIILQKIGDKTFRKIAEKKFKIEKQVITYKGKSFPITDDIYLYEDKKKSYCFIDYTNEQIITLHSNGIGVDAEFLDELLTTSRVGLVGQLMAVIHKGTEDVEKDWGLKLKPFIYILIGGMAGYIIAGGGV